jgi:hypothetical protein
LSDNSKSTQSQWLSLLLGTQGLIVAALWGFAEGTLFFIVPDLILTLTALFSLKRACLQAVVVTAGALIAGSLMFSWSTQDKAAATQAVAAVPLVKAEMTLTVQNSYQAHGAGALLRGPLNGIPYKLYAIEAPAQLPLSTFLLMSIPARLQRFVSGLLLFGGVGWWQRQRIARHPNRALALWAAYWLLIYAAYFFLI